MNKKDNQDSKFLILCLGALGVVFGDIGTSPLYAIKEIFAINNNILTLTNSNMLGILSLIFWSLISIVSVKYILFIMRANNNGEGGIMALLSLASRNAKTKGKRLIIISIGMLGAAMFYADAMITPAISVISAIEGIELITPAFSAYIVPITLIIIFILTDCLKVFRCLTLNSNLKSRLSRKIVFTVSTFSCAATALIPHT